MSACMDACGTAKGEFRGRSDQIISRFICLGNVINVTSKARAVIRIVKQAAECDPKVPKIRRVMSKFDTNKMSTVY